jgi:sarcosine oxidase subunit alpha
MSANRTSTGGWLIDRSRQETFSFDGRDIPFHPGDTIASALLASGDKLIGRSFKLHRPRGVFALGADEPNALVTIGSGGRLTPNARATVIPAQAGLEITSQNRWPNLKTDIFGLLDRVRPLLPAGFYYKTFMWPASQWLRYEHFIRRMAGLGPPPREADPDTYTNRHTHTDVLIAGGGPAGLAAAEAAGKAGRDVILAGSGADFGGGLNNRSGGAHRQWLTDTLASLEAMPNVRLMRNTTVAGYYEYQLLTLAERVADRTGNDANAPTERFWHVRAEEVVIATGATERPMLFVDNDRPGAMLAGAAAGYLWRYGVLVGRQPVLFGGDDSIYTIARDLAEAGADIRAIVDTRSDPGDVASKMAADGFRVLSGSMVARAHGRHRVTAAEIWRIDQDAPHLIETTATDVILTSGGHGPSLQLHAQAKGGLDWDDGLATFMPGDAKAPHRSVGAARGIFEFGAAIRDGEAGGRAEAAPDRSTVSAGTAPRPWELPNLTGGPRFVDLQNDVADKDIALAAREGYHSIEHVKRYTTLGMGTDQGKMAGPVGLALLAATTGKEIAATGVTTFRPPATPVTFGAVAGGHFGEVGHAIRRTAADRWHESASATFIDAGLWRRPQFYAANGATLGEAYRAEAKAVRTKVGMVDVSTLGKIDVSGPDAAALMDKLYCNTMSTLKTGRGRYGLMLREDGRVFDDGVVFRLSDERYHVTCTTGGAGAVYQHIEYALQVLWPEMDVYATPVSEEWFALALAGPGARSLLGAALPGLDVSNEALPMMWLAETKIFGQRARVMRMSYSGELSYEINIGADWGLALWEHLVTVGKAHKLTVYGTEAMGALRIEKGHVTHAEADGRMTAEDLGLGKMVSKKKDAIGVRALRFAALNESGRKQLVGLIANDAKASFPVGAQVTAENLGDTPRPSLGHVTAYAYSHELGRTIALALLRNGRAMTGDQVYVVSPIMGESAAATISNPVFIDPDGERLRG